LHIFLNRLSFAPLAIFYIGKSPSSYGLHAELSLLYGIRGIPPLGCALKKSISSQLHMGLHNI
jgi:hypothetical protein